MFGFLNFLKRKPVKTSKTSNSPSASSGPTKIKTPTPETPFKAPSKKQLEECGRLGLKVTEKMSSRDVWQMIQDAKNDPKLKKLYDEYVAEQNAIFEAEEREEYGDAVVDELKKWESLCQVGVHHLVVFKKGKTLTADILEFERANIEDENKVYVKIAALRPKIYKPRGESPYIDWIREISFKPNQILEIKTLNKAIDMFDIEDFEQHLNSANQMKQKYE